MIPVLTGMAAIVLGTWLGAPVLSPIVVGAVMGFAWPARAARRAAITGMLTWGGLLLVALARGDALGAFSTTLGDAMGVPAWSLFIVTLLYPAILASSAAWLAHLVSPRRSATFDEGATARSGHPTT
jgi:hypothetical protein